MSDVRESTNKSEIWIAVISFPFASPVPQKLIAELSEILHEISSNVLIIGSAIKDEDGLPAGVYVRDIHVHLHYVLSKKRVLLSYFEWISKWAFIQLRVAIEVIRRRKEFDLALFYLTFPYHFPALLISRCLGLKTVEIVTRSQYGSHVPWHVFQHALNRLDFLLLSKISLESPSIARSLPVRSFKHKLTEFGARFVDTSRFRVETAFEERSNCVGFLGRLTPEKGVLAFVESIPMIIMEESKCGLSEISFLIGGSGPLEGQVRKEIENINSRYGQRIEYLGWVKEEDLPSFLNRSRLLVMPTTHSEGLPTIVLDAMACGSVVLAPPVGGIPDVITDGETGYILRSLDAHSLSETVVRALKNPATVDISRNASKLISVSYTFEGAVERYRTIVRDTSDSG